MRRIFPLPVSHPWQLLIGLGVWAVWFVTVYGAVSVACSAASAAADGGPATWINGALLALTLAVAGALGFAAVVCARAARRVGGVDEEDGLRRFIAVAATTLYGVAAASTLFVGIPLLFLAPCV